jgi:positive phototaxis protein PixI
MIQPNPLTQAESRQKYLSFRLGEKDAGGIPVPSILETFPLSLNEVLPVPQMPTWVLGIYNWRGDMLWIVDLEELLGYNPSHSVVDSTLNPMTIVIRLEEKTLGVIVSQVTDIEEILSSQQKPPSSELFNPDVIPFIDSYTIDEEERILIQLNPQAIMNFSNSS